MDPDKGSLEMTHTKENRKERKKEKKMWEALSPHLGSDSNLVSKVVDY